MRTRHAAAAVFLLTVSVLACPLAEAEPPDIESVEIAPNRAFLVNGKPFFPLMAWLQDAKNFPALKACAMNTTAGYWSGSSGTKHVSEYLDLVAKAGLYGVMPFDPKLKGRPKLLAYIHGDEPDLPRQVNDAKITPAKNLRISSRTPLWKILDGTTHSWSVLDPLKGASLTIELKKPVTVEKLAVWVTVSKGLALPKTVAFEAGGEEILTATLEPKRGRQSFELPKPATFQTLRFRVLTVVPGKHVWGSLCEIEGFNAEGKNVLLSPPRKVPRQTPAQTMKHYEAIKAADPSRSVFMTLTGNFHPHFKRVSEEYRALYPKYVRAADVVGYDIYPIYGWNKPQWLHLVHEATGRLVKMADPRPVYAWIETSKGGQWTVPLAKQKEVTPTHIRAEVWMAICQGATAIGYFTHIWKPSYKQFGVPEANRKALRAINEQIARLAPAILGKEPNRDVAIIAEGDAKLNVLARQHGGELYLFAVNYDERLKRVRATIKVEGLDARTPVTVVDEDRTLKSEGGQFTDAFAPLAVHIYRVAP